MLKHIVLAAFLTCGAAAAYAQPQQAAGPPASTTVDSKMAPSATADTRKLIGRKIKNADDETIGEIKSIYINKEGKVDSVMVGVGGFLGMGDREVRIAWSDLKITDNGEKVMVNMTKDELKAKPEYRYKNESWRGQVFTDTGPWAARPSDTARAADAPRPANDQLAQTTKPPADRSTDKPSDRPNLAATTSTGDFNAAGEMSGNALIGATVRNEKREAVGKIEDVYVDNSGAIKTVVVAVGGFLGVGAKDVAVKWSDLKFSRDDKSIVIMTSWTKESLKAMPDYKYERRQPANKSGG
ncbi:MAG TPA: PRC-barrel domain-containing protein [Reyranella sp.]